MPFVSIDRIRIDGGTQIRAYLDDDTVDDYAEAYKRGDPMPPIIAFDDGLHLWLSDGFHRLAGALKAGMAQIDVDIRKGSQREALLFAAGANATHGLRRTNDDKRRAVSLLLDDPEWAACSNNWLAEKCGVSDGLVASVRATHRQAGSNSGTTNNSRDTRTAKDGKQQPASKPVGWCDRCTRHGVQSKDCRRCAELQQKRGETKRHARDGVFDLKSCEHHVGYLVRGLDDLKRDLQRVNNTATADLQRRIEKVRPTLDNVLTVVEEAVTALRGTR